MDVLALLGLAEIETVEPLVTDDLSLPVMAEHLRRIGCVVGAQLLEPLLTIASPRAVGALREGHATDFFPATGATVKVLHRQNLEDYANELILIRSYIEKELLEMRLGLHGVTQSTQLPLITVGVLWTSIVQLLSMNLEAYLQIYMTEKVLPTNDHQTVFKILKMASMLTVKIQALLEKRDAEVAVYMEERGFVQQTVSLAYSPLPIKQVYDINRGVGDRELVHRIDGYVSPRHRGGVTRLEQFSRARADSIGRSRVGRSTSQLRSSSIQSARDREFDEMDFNQDGVVDRREWNRAHGSDSYVEGKLGSDVYGYGRRSSIE